MSVSTGGEKIQLPPHDFLKNWTPEEKQKYLDLYQYYPKHFSKISAGIGTKTTKECIFFYYHRHRSTLELPKAVRKARRPPVDVTPKTKQKSKVLKYS